MTGRCTSWCKEGSTAHKLVGKALSIARKARPITSKVQLANVKELPAYEYLRKVPSVFLLY